MLTIIVINAESAILKGYTQKRAIYLDKPTFVGTAEPLPCSQGRHVPSCHRIDVLLVRLRLEVNAGRMITGVATKGSSVKESAPLTLRGTIMESGSMRLLMGTSL